MKIYFVQDNTFLRTPQKTNPFFDPIIKVCEENGIEWKVWLPARPNTCGYDEKHVEYYWIFNALGTWFWRFVHLVWRVEAWRIYYLFGRLMRPFFRKKFEADVCITIAQTMFEHLLGLFPDKRIVDLQHGVIYSNHKGYMNPDRRSREVFRIHTNCSFWLYGQGYADCFFKHPENAKDLAGRVKIIGDLLGVTRHYEKNEGAKRDTIVVSLQYTNDFGKDVLQSWTDDLVAVFDQMEAAGVQKRYRVLLKHHPRYANCFDISPMMKRFPWLQLTSQLTDDLIRRAAYHITYCSTTAFEYAAEGVPTLFTGSEKNRMATDLMYGEYGYPLPMSFETMRKALEDSGELARQGEQVRAWYHKFYATFYSSKCLALLCGERADVL